MIRWQGFSLLAQATHSLRHCSVIIIAGGGYDLPDDVAMFRRIEDAENENGPRAGIVAGLEFALAEGFDVVQFSPCDTPLADAGLFQRLLEMLTDHDCAIPMSSNRMHPLHALVRPEEFQKAMQETPNDVGIHRIFERLNDVRIEVDDELMLNINTDEEIERLNEIDLNELRKKRR